MHDTFKPGDVVIVVWYLNINKLPHPHFAIIESYAGESVYRVKYLKPVWGAYKESFHSCWLKRVDPLVALAATELDHEE